MPLSIKWPESVIIALKLWMKLAAFGCLLQHLMVFYFSVTSNLSNHAQQDCKEWVFLALYCCWESRNAQPLEWVSLFSLRVGNITCHQAAAALLLAVRTQNQGGIDGVENPIVGSQTANSESFSPWNWVLSDAVLLVRWEQEVNKQDPE